MLIDTLRRMLVLVLLCLAQALVFNRIQLFICAIPLVYVYFIIIFPRSYPRWALLLWGFFMGVAVDMFTDTPGLAATSLTLIALLQPMLIELFLPRDAENDIRSSAATLGWGNFSALAFFLVLVYCLVFFTIETFSFAHWLYWLECIGASTLLTYILILTLESVRK